MNPRIFLIAFLIITAWSCKKEKAVIAGFDNSAKVIATITGTVLDEDGVPKSGVTVICNNFAVNTNSFGKFAFDSVPVLKNAQVIKFEMQGYFKTYRTVSTEKGKETYTMIKLHKKENPTVFGSMAGAIIQKNGVTVELPRLGYKDKITGNIYSGQVHAYVQTIKTDDSDFGLKMPGDLRGIDSSSQETILTTFGMIGVELEDENGRELQLTNDAEAKLSMPIAADKLANAPTEIPLWHFDETKAMWIEEGKAIKVGNSYQGKVKHFSFWNWSDPLVLATFGTITSVKLVDAQGNPLNYLLVKFKCSSYEALGFTNNLGEVNVILLRNNTYTLSIDALGCPNVIYSTTFTATTPVLNIGTINIGNNPNIMLCKGTFVDCNNIPMPNAKGQYKYGNYVRLITANNSGNFSFTIPACATSIICEIQGFDSLVYGKQTLTLAGGLNNIGNFQCCGYFFPFLEYYCSLDSAGGIIDTSLLGGFFDSRNSPLPILLDFRYSASSSYKTTLNANKTTLYATQSYGPNAYSGIFPSSNTNQLTFEFDGSGSVGSHSISLINSHSLYYGYQAFTQFPTYVTTTTSAIGSSICNVPVTITEYSQVPNSGYIKGNFNGTFYDSTGCKMAVNGRFVVERNF